MAGNFFNMAGQPTSSGPTANTSRSAEGGLDCVAGSSQPVNLTVNFYLYIPIQGNRRRLLNDQNGYRPRTQDVCAKQWQWAFDDNGYPQPAQMGDFGNPRKLVGHLDIEYQLDCWSPSLPAGSTDDAMFS